MMSMYLAIHIAEIEYLIVENIAGDYIAPDKLPEIRSVFIHTKVFGFHFFAFQLYFLRSSHLFGFIVFSFVTSENGVYSLVSIPAPNMSITEGEFLTP